MWAQRNTHIKNLKDRVVFYSTLRADKAYEFPREYHSLMVNDTAPSHIVMFVSPELTEIAQRTPPILAPYLKTVAKTAHEQSNTYPQTTMPRLHMVIYGLKNPNIPLIYNERMEDCFYMGQFPNVVDCLNILSYGLDIYMIHKKNQQK